MIIEKMKRMMMMKVQRSDCEVEDPED
jgi:hypothetical protein